MWAPCGGTGILLADEQHPIPAIPIECHKLCESRQASCSDDNHRALIKMKLSDLPHDLVWLIMEYKAEMEAHEHWVRFIEVVLRNLLWPGFIV